MSGGTLRTEYAIRWTWPDGSRTLSMFGHRPEDKRRAEHTLATRRHLDGELVHREVRITDWAPVHPEQPRQRRVRTRRRR
ncbi:hypothetical protein [Saccharothrix xinjiangensis]|uniref:Uncharacterized protein n=1 Tax=Saccharothrix xinjiangensis TaxID=204798 RepID=A0ABV9XVV5_9PSEU